MHLKICANAVLDYAAAKLQGLEKSLNLSDSECKRSRNTTVKAFTDFRYSHADETGLSILFVGYVRLHFLSGVCRENQHGVTNHDAQVLMQVPSNALLNWSGKPSWYIGFWTIAWGLVSTLTSQVTTFGDIVACRFILGFVEAPFFCGVIFYLSKWYTKSELSFRMAIFYSASLVSGAFGSLIAAGILSGLSKLILGENIPSQSLRSLELPLKVPPKPF